MTEKPILFSGEMVKAILAGTKTQTRRLVKPQPHDIPNRADFHWKCPYRVTQLWVRENWHFGARWQNEHEQGAIIAYAEEKQTVCKHLTEDQFYALKQPDALTETWRQAKTIPSIFMPRWASRLTLRITDIRCERLGQISNEDAVAEGVHCPSWTGDGPDERAAEAFAALWDRVHGKGSWNQHKGLWVWVISFERVK